MLPKLPSFVGASFWKIALLAVVLFIPLVLVTLILGIGVVLPAVWSRSPQRQEAAFKILELIVSTFRSRQRRNQ
ncbi:hypothetical protein HUF15_45090 [Streptomyces samsunensis]|uniref:hypothetical protein n=1 Tax=Streptomyces malaysiensis TaxID=92644 RepID=UPI001582B56F|nr:hypothetical protein [Streptomyces samsunensis]NUH43781.1 hypothetical protein [Streptomyces samsunensis]